MKKSQVKSSGEGREREREREREINHIIPIARKLSSNGLCPKIRANHLLFLVANDTLFSPLDSDFFIYKKKLKIIFKIKII